MSRVSEGLPGALVVKNLPAREVREVGGIPGPGGRPGGGLALHSSILVWRILWTEALAGTTHRAAQGWTRLEQLCAQLVSHTERRICPWASFAFAIEQKVRQSLLQGASLPASAAVQAALGSPLASQAPQGHPVMTSCPGAVAGSGC